MSTKEKAATEQQEATPAGKAQEKEAQEAKAEKAHTEVEVAADQSAVTEENPLEVLRRDLDDARDQMVRAQAEMANARRRAERDVENAHKYALEKFVSELLPVVDNLERAIQAMDASDEAQRAACEGVELTLKSFLDVLRRFNVEAIDPAGDTFNPELHQAMTLVPTADATPNTVLEVFQKGYRLNGRLVRPAMVVVAQAANGNGNGQG